MSIVYGMHSYSVWTCFDCQSLGYKDMNNVLIFDIFTNKILLYHHNHHSIFDMDYVPITSDVMWDGIWWNWRIRLSYVRMVTSCGFWARPLSKWPPFWKVWIQVHVGVGHMYYSCMHVEPPLGRAPNKSSIISTFFRLSFLLLTYYFFGLLRNCSLGGRPFFHVWTYSRWRNPVESGARLWISHCFLDSSVNLLCLVLTGVFVSRIQLQRSIIRILCKVWDLSLNFYIECRLFWFLGVWLRCKIRLRGTFRRSYPIHALSICGIASNRLPLVLLLLFFVVAAAAAVMSGKASSYLLGIFSFPFSYHQMYQNSGCFTLKLSGIPSGPKE